MSEPEKQVRNRLKDVDQAKPDSTPSTNESTVIQPSTETDKTGKFSLVTEKTDNRGTHPNSRANLTPFEKGVSGNPSGRPMKYEKFKEALMKYRDEEVDGWQLERNTNLDNVLNTIWYKAGQGSISHINLLAQMGCLDAE